MVAGQRVPLVRSGRTSHCHSCRAQDFGLGYSNPDYELCEGMSLQPCACASRLTSWPASVCFVKNLVPPPTVQVQQELRAVAALLPAALAAFS